MWRNSNCPALTRLGRACYHAKQACCRVWPKVLLACSQCGSAHHENAVICPACRQPFASPLDPQAAWRKELAARFEAYRSRRRGRVGEEEGQKSLPFLPAPNGVGGGASGPAGHNGNIFVLPPQPPRPLRITIREDQPRLAFPESSVAEQVSAQVPVAAMRLRVRAGLVDAAFLALACLAFLAMFHFLGGRLIFAKTELAILSVSAYLLYAQYFFLFVGFAGATPGMRWVGLDTSNFAGEPATRRQLLWRGFGYLVSGGSLFLGFVWSLVDEERLTWHDRISQTILTVLPEASRR